MAWSRIRPFQKQLHLFSTSTSPLRCSNAFLSVNAISRSRSKLNQPSTSIPFSLVRHQSSSSTSSNPSNSSSSSSNSTNNSSSSFSKSPIKIILSLSALTITGTILSIRFNHDSTSDRPLQRAPLSTLFRSLFVYSVCSIPFVVDAGPGIIEWCRDTQIPGVWKVTEFIVRNTFFKQVSNGIQKR